MKNIIFILLLTMFINSCSSQVENNNNMSINNELVRFLYKNYNKLDFDDDLEELIFWDLDNENLKKVIRNDFKHDDSLVIKLNKLEEVRKSFYLYSIKKIEEDYQKYKYSDGPFFDYLVEKKDGAAKKLIIKIINDPNISQDKKDEIGDKLNNWNFKYELNDPDGYVNLRQEGNLSSKVLKAVSVNERIEVLNHSGSWWLIKMNSGIKGYVHNSRIKIIDE